MTAATAPTRLTPACKGREHLFDAAAEALERWKPDQPEPAVVRDARDICSACPAAVRAGCLAAALRNRERFGVWAGTTPEDRAALEAATWLIEPPTTPQHGRSCATSGRCDCQQGRDAHAAYVRQWRSQGPSHSRAEHGRGEQLALTWED